MTHQQKPPHFFRRLAAISYDLLLLIAILFIATSVALPLQDGEAFTPNSLSYSLYLLGVSFLFYAWFWTKSGQTLGLLAWKLQVCHTDGSLITWKQALIRFIVAIVSWAALGLGVFWVFFNKDRLTWYDICSNSRVVWKQSQPTNPSGES